MSPAELPSWLQIIQYAKTARSTRAAWRSKKELANRTEVKPFENSAQTDNFNQRNVIAHADQSILSILYQLCCRWLSLINLAHLYRFVKFFSIAIQQSGWYIHEYMEIVSSNLCYRDCCFPVRSADCCPCVGAGIALAVRDVDSACHQTSDWFRSSARWHLQPQSATTSGNTRM
jgi:hypothetical protein